MGKKIILILSLLILNGCQEDKSSASTSKSKYNEAEVKRRVEIIEDDLKIRQTKLHTIRIIGLIVLAGGSVGLLVWLQRGRGIHSIQTLNNPPPLTHWQDHYQVPDTRVIDIQPPEPVIIRQTRNQNTKQTQSRNNNRPKKHRHAPTSHP
jgi:hypothetical protein